MAQRYVLIRVVGRDGRPQAGKRIWLTGIGFGHGLSKEGRTDSSGGVEFEVDYDKEVEIYVDGTKRVGGEKIRGEFRISI